MNRVIVVVVPSQKEMLAGQYMTVTFEGINARNEAIGYCMAMRQAGFWPDTTQAAIDDNGETFKG